MAATTYQIEELIQEADLRFFRSEDGEAWLFSFRSCHVVARLQDDGKTLIFRGSLLADLSDLPPREHHRALQHFMRRNDQIKLGRFCGTSEISFEIGLPICDGELTARQLSRCVHVTADMTREGKYPPKPEADGDGECDAEFVASSDSDEGSDAEPMPSRLLECQPLLEDGDKSAESPSSIERN